VPTIPETVHLIPGGYSGKRGAKCRYLGDGTRPQFLATVVPWVHLPHFAWYRSSQNFISWDEICHLGVYHSAFLPLGGHLTNLCRPSLINFVRREVY